LLDLKMPYLDGFQIMEQLKALDQNSYLPIIILTAQNDREHRLQALSAGAKDFISKPIDQIEVLFRISNALEIRSLNKQVFNQNRILEMRVLEKTQELRETQLEIIKRLSFANEYRDNETGLHVVRMSHYAAIIGKIMGINDYDIELLLNAGPMHDIGKIGIPDPILLKPGKLTLGEWRIMKDHTTIGANILSGSKSPLLKTAEVIALTHHEKWNGSGYPQGLKGKEIPLFGRICAVCDVFDALTTDRPYKKAWSVERAVNELIASKGSHFDPLLVEYFVAGLPEILKIYHDYQEPS
jgi:putative two-component system response regulator